MFFGVILSPVEGGSGYPGPPLPIAMFIPGVRSPQSPRSPGAGAGALLWRGVQRVHWLGPVRRARHPVLREVIEDVLQQVINTWLYRVSNTKKCIVYVHLDKRLSHIREQNEANLGQSLPLGCQLVLDLWFISEEDLLHSLKDMLVLVEISDVQNILQ